MRAWPLELLPGGGLSQREQDDLHSSNPVAGDYWHEMFVPCFVILERVGANIVFCETTKRVGEGRWTWDLSDVRMCSVEEFVKRVKYSSSYEGYWCDVAPGAHKDVSEYYIENKKQL